MVTCRENIIEAKIRNINNSNWKVQKTIKAQYKYKWESRRLEGLCLHDSWPIKFLSTHVEREVLLYYSLVTLYFWMTQKLLFHSFCWDSGPPCWDGCCKPHLFFTSFSRVPPSLCFCNKFLLIPEEKRKKKKLWLFWRPVRCWYLFFFFF